MVPALTRGLTNEKSQGQRSITSEKGRKCDILETRHFFIWHSNPNALKNLGGTFI